eukprot:m51a1_g7302 hypothetical protein (1065) ;mRNA; r:88172-91782
MTEADDGLEEAEQEQEQEQEDEDEEEEDGGQTSGPFADAYFLSATADSPLSLATRLQPPQAHPLSARLPGPLRPADPARDASLAVGAVEAGSSALAESIVERCPLCVACARAGDGETVLAAACRAGGARLAGAPARLVRRVLGCGADPDQAGAGGAIPLIEAVKAGRLDLVKLLMDAGANSDARDRTGVTALVLAARMRSAEAVAQLLDAGADPDACSRDGDTPLLAIARSLLAHGADPNGVGEAMAVGGPRGGPDGVGTPLYVALALHRAELVEALVSAGARALDLSRRETALADAAAAGRRELVQLILRACGAAMPLPVAAALGMSAEVGAMLEAGADPDASFGGETPLVAAARAGSADTAILLLAAGARADLPGGSGQTALQAAVLAGAADVVEMLLDSHADLNSPAHRSSVVVDAVDAGRGDILASLLRFGADPNALDANGDTAVLHAVRRSRTECLRILLAAGASPNPAVAGAESPVRCAVEMGSADFVASLVACAPPPAIDDETVFAAAKSGHADMAALLCDESRGLRTPLVVAAMLGMDSAVARLLEDGADPNAPLCGETALAAAARGRKAELVLFLLMAGADPNVPSGDGALPLEIAVRGDDEAVALLLLDWSGKVTAGLLHECIGRKNSAMLGKLLSHGADPNAEHLGATALEAAVAQGSVEMVSLLRTAGADPRAVPDAELLAAARALNEEQVQMLLVASGREIPLVVAATLGREDLVAALLREGSDPNTPLAGEYAIVAAARPGFRDCVRVLLAQGADPEPPGVADTPLLLSVASGRADIARLLVNAKARSGPVDRRATVAAIRSGRADVVRELLDAGAETNFYAEDSTPLLMALGIPDKSAAAEIAGLLLLHHAHPCLVPPKQQSPLAVSIAQGLPATAAQLIDCGADLPKQELPQAFRSAVRLSSDDLCCALLRIGFAPEARDAWLAAKGGLDRATVECVRARSLVLDIPAEDLGALSSPQTMRAISLAATELWCPSIMWLLPAEFPRPEGVVSDSDLSSRHREVWRTMALSTHARLGCESPLRHVFSVVRIARTLRSFCQPMVCRESAGT